MRKSIKCCRRRSPGWNNWSRCPKSELTVMAFRNLLLWLRQTENTSTSSKLRMGPVTSSGMSCFSPDIVRLDQGSLYSFKRFNNNINCSTFRSPVDKTLSRKDERSKNLDKTQGQEHIQENNNGQEVPSHQHRTPSFRYHLVSTNSSRPIVGIYLPEGSN